MLSRQALRLVANLRNIPESMVEKPVPKCVLHISDVFSKLLQTKYKQSTQVLLLENLQDHWQSWFSGTDFAATKPDRVDRWSCLWIKVPDPILCQKLQFKSARLLKTLNLLLNSSIKDIRWFV